MGTNLFLTCTLVQVNTKSFFNGVQLGNAYQEWKVLGIWISPAFFLHRHNIHRYTCNSFPSGTFVTGDTIKMTPVNNTEYLAHFSRKGIHLDHSRDIRWGHRGHFFLSNNL